VNDGHDPEPSRETLIGRESDLQFLEALVERIGSAGQALLLRGEAGVGKSALLAEAARLADARGLRVLRAAGVEFEADVSFSALNQLLQPLFEDLESLDAWQREALTTALGLKPGPRSDELVLANAVLALLALAATRAPLLLVVDDIPWLDRASARALAFVGRRLSQVPVGLIAASRIDEESVLYSAGLPTHLVEPLTHRSAAELLATRYPAMPPRARRRLLSEAQGNPLALLELPAALELPARGTPGPLPALLPLSRRLQGMFAGRVNTLPTATRTALLVAILDGSGDLAIVRAAYPEDPDAFGPAVRALLVRVDDRTDALHFRHPLIRSAVVESATGKERRAAHRLLAAVHDADLVRRAWHLAEAATGPDEQVAALLQEAAHHNRWRGDSVGAIAELVRAAELSPDGTDRARRLAEAAYLGETVTGDIKDVRALLEATARADPQHHGGLAGAVAEAYLALNELGDIDGAHRRLVDAIAALDDPTDAHDKVLIETLQTLMLVCSYGGRADLWEPFEVALSRLRPRPPTRTALAARAWADPVNVDRKVLDQLDDVITQLDLETSPARIIRTAMCGVYLDRISAAREALWRAVQHGREGGAVTSAIKALLLLCDDSLMGGAWDEVEELSAEVGALAIAHGYLLLNQRVIYYPAMVAAARGDGARARSVSDQILGWATPRRSVALQRLAHHANSLAAAGRGDFETAYAEASAVSPPGRLDAYNPHALRVVYDLVDSAVRVGRREEAAAHAQAAEEAGVADLSPRLAMVVAATQALTRRGAQQSAAFEAALGIVGTEGFPFDRARIQLAYGERLRRGRSHAEGRAQLSAALATFELLGAEPWADRAANELRAAGHVPRRPAALDQTVALTPQQLEIASLAAAGLTNKQIGERLFLSHRTVATHLYQIFPKLGVTSRAALRDALTQVSTPVEPAR
jgi:DNA-binding CsgD family transcriptional regulator